MVGGVPAPVEGEGQGRALAGGGDAVQLGKAGHQRLVAQDPSHPGGHRLLDLVGVHGLPRGDADDVGSHLVEHAPVVVEGRHLSPDVAPALDEPGAFLGAVVEDTRDGGLGVVAEGGGEVVASGLAQDLPVAAGDGDAKHGITFPWPGGRQPARTSA